jgi:hypothetical protein
MFGPDIGFEAEESVSVVMRTVGMKRMKRNWGFISVKNTAEDGLLLT